MKKLIDLVEKEKLMFQTAEHAAVYHLEMAHAHLFEETEGRNLNLWLSDIEKIIKEIEKSQKEQSKSL